MTETKKASFTLKKFAVPNFSYNESKENPELNLSFDVSGEYQKADGIFNLILDFKGNNGDNNQNVISAKVVGIFKFSEVIDLKEIPEYFYTNAIAIIFPYLRSFVSTLTLQANTGVIILETLNLTGLKNVLKEKTKTI
ncbi:preprotein translocase subunit SecB [Tenacibaculum adriaticum]|uniref:Preprotein translocase subunit SecB n=1 Tax=Tenacibaculum adriaticum TaxID=413713 RepID=A0A5S5E1A6_9FLAO|nr:protein-export chaperone SecB [Tenacibaculum adriaticum]TYQ00420.1 preprotein translocase subunit SecB [Tenacibaculum adriaticum]